MKLSLKLDDNLLNKYLNVVKYFAIFVALIFLSLGAFSQSDSLLQKALEYNNMGEDGKALNLLNNYIAANPNIAKAHYFRGFVYFNLKTYKRAEKDFRKTIDLDASYAKAYYGLCEVYGVDRQFSKCIDVLNDLMKVEGDLITAEAMNLRGSCFYKMKQYQKAFADFESAIELDDSLALAYNNRGSARYHVQNIDEPSERDKRLAKKDFTRAIVLDERMGDAWRNRGMVNVYLGDSAAAQSDLEMAEKLNPLDLYVYYYKSLNYSNQKLHKAALIEINRSFAINNKVPEAYLQRGSTLGFLNRIEEALADYEEAVILDKKLEIKVAYRKAIMYAYNEDEKEMLNHLQKAHNFNYFKNIRNYNEFMSNENFKNYLRNEEFNYFVRQVTKQKKVVPDDW